MSEGPLFCVFCGAAVPHSQIRCPRCRTRLDFAPLTWTAVAILLGLGTMAWHLHRGTALLWAIAAGATLALMVRLLTLLARRKPKAFAASSPRAVSLGVLFIVLAITIVALQPTDSGGAFFGFVVFPAMMFGLSYAFARSPLASFVIAPGTTRCPHCAALNSFRALYCRYCGRDLSAR